MRPFFIALNDEWLVNEWLTHSLTRVGIELLGQLKTQISIDPDRSEKTRIAQGWSGYIWTSIA